MNTETLWANEADEPNKPIYAATECAADAIEIKVTKIPRSDQEDFDRREAQKEEYRLLHTILATRQDQADRNAIVKSNLCDAALQLSKAHFADEDCAFIFGVTQAYFNKYGEVPSNAVLRDIFDHNESDEENKTRWQMLLHAKIYFLPEHLDVADYARFKDVLVKRLTTTKNYELLVAALEANKLGQFDVVEKKIEEASRMIAKTTSGKRFKLESAADLQAMDIEPPRFVVEGLVPEGLVLLAAEKKTGKSAFAMQMAHCVAEGLPFFGFKTSRGQVIYYSMEQGRNVNKQRLQMQKAGFSKNLKFIADEDRSNLSKMNQYGLAEMQTMIDEANQNADSKVVMIVIDVWQCLTPNPNGKQNAYENDNRVLTPLKNLADELHIAVVIIHHERKAKADNGDVFNDIQGSNGITGKADSILLLKRERNERNGILHVTSRVAKELKLAVSFDDETLTWKNDGDFADLRGDLHDDIVAIFQRDKAELKLDELICLLEDEYGLRDDAASNRRVRVMVARMTAKGELQRVRRGAYLLVPQPSDLINIPSSENITPWLSGHEPSDGTLEALDHPV